jgi:hypothetical protein
MRPEFSSENSMARRSAGSWLAQPTGFADTLHKTKAAEETPPPFLFAIKLFL